MSWRKSVPPYSSVWQAVTDRAKNYGLVHGVFALERFPRGNYSPADAADLLSDMVDAGEIKPIKKDLAGAGHSVRAFRGLGPSAGGAGEKNWCRAESPLWTYEIVKTA